jgi:hypothetical protein
MLDGQFREHERMPMRNLIWIAAVILAFAASASADNGGIPNMNDNTQSDRALEDRRVDQIALATTDTNALITKIVVVTGDCAFRAETNDSRRRNVNKVGITQDMPFIGEFFAKTPRQGQLNSANQVGLVYLERPALYIDLRQTSGSPTADRALLEALGAAAAGGQGVAFAPNTAAAPYTAFSVINRNFQFTVPRGNFAATAPTGTSCGGNAMTRLPPLAPLFDKAVGSAHLLDGQLVVLIRPSIIAGY